MKKKTLNLLDVNIEEQCRRIAIQNIPNVEVWLHRLGQEDPGRAIKAWVEIAEFAQSKKGRDGSVAPPQQIVINMVPKEKKETPKLDMPPTDYEDIPIE